MVQLIPPESFRKRWKSSDEFLLSRSNRNDRKIPVPFLNFHSTRFPAFPHCRYNRRFDLSLFSSSRERLGRGQTPHRKNPVPLRAFHSNRIFRANGKRPSFQMTVENNYAFAIDLIHDSRHVVFAFITQSSYTLLRGKTRQVRFVLRSLNVYHLSSKIECLHKLLRCFFSEK